MTPAATPAIAALVAADIGHQVLHYRHNRRHDSFGQEAVDALAQLPGCAGVVPEQVFKTLILTLGRGLAVAVLPVPTTVSLKAAAAAFGAPKATLADPAAAQRSTGYPVGGISPFGQRRILPTVVDSSALRWDRVFCSAGKRGWELAVAPADLIALTGATTAEIAVGHRR